MNRMIYSAGLGKYCVLDHARLYHELLHTCYYVLLFYVIMYS